MLIDKVFIFSNQEQILEMRIKDLEEDNESLHQKLKRLENLSKSKNSQTPKADNLAMDEILTKSKNSNP